MEINQSIKIRNYKCFGNEEQGYDKILPINIIIGKNNSGKSTLIELIQFIVEGNEDSLERRMEENDVEVLVAKKIDSELSAFHKGHSGGPFQGDHNAEATRLLSGKNFTYRYRGLRNGRPVKQAVNLETLLPVAAVKSYTTFFNDSICVPLSGKIFRKISAERDIKRELDHRNSTDQIFDFSPDGTGISTLIQMILNRQEFDSRLIEDILLNDLNKILYPEVHFDRILVQRNGDYWEIFFYENGTRVALSKMGSGIKTILQVLLNLLVVPIHHGKDKSKYVFAFEELENNLHPAILRRLFNYISDYSKKHSAYFFITTHSNVVIDTFGTNPIAQLIHVSRMDNESKALSILSHQNTKQVLKELDIRASDLLQCNGIIWVEGPSDRIYINKWLNLVAPELLEGMHYSIMFYGGRLLANTSLNVEWLEKDVIPLIKINTNAYIIIDSDKKNETDNINKTKQRIREEVGEGNCWITQGREIENYLSSRVLNEWITTDYKKVIAFEHSKSKKLETTLKDAGIKIDYNKDKKGFSTGICTYVKKEDLEVLDLGVRVQQLVDEIKRWNSLSLPTAASLQLVATNNSSL